MSGYENKFEELEGIIEIYNKLNQVRIANKSTTIQKVFSIVIAIIAGVIC